MNNRFIIFLTVGAFAILLCMMIIGIKYRVKLWKCLLVTLAGTIVGTVGTYGMFFVEHSQWGARSYYGAVYLIPIVFVAFAKLIRIPYGDLMDLCAPAMCVMLAFMKYQCWLDGCCSGRVLYYTAEETAVFFPSQIAELINAVIILVMIMILVFSSKMRGKLYPLYMVVYGSTRFVLSIFREQQDPLLAGLTPSYLWSLIAIFVGALWLCNRKIAIVKSNISIEQPLEN